MENFDILKMTICQRLVVGNNPERAENNPGGVRRPSDRSALYLPLVFGFDFSSDHHN